MKLSVVITTRNEADNIANCIKPFDAFRDDVEVIVVDNSSTDDTALIAQNAGARVLVKGPERSAQRNLGWRESSSEWVIILDADMILPLKTIEEILALADSSEGSAADAYWIPEVRTGEGIRVKARNFERSFYDGTCVDALRLFKRSVLEKTGGYDENLIAGPEDWDLDVRVLASGAKCAVLGGHLIHNEKRLSFKRMLEKKAYYSKSMAAYCLKWKGNPVLKKQLGFYYRFLGVFIENGKWKKLLKHPILAAVMYFERVAVGFTYLCNRG
ncbi:MAG: glycosyltransferase [Kiritimatiellae bacterium]|nr:glycosyltransferase [Kiritimatiellia bacterium]